MTRLSRVVWSEGMYIGPHHFQAQNRYFEDSVQFSTASLWFQPFGFIGFEMDPDALRNGTLALRHARGIFPDGLGFHMPEFDEPPAPRNIADAFPPLQDTVDVLLSVPAHQPEGRNCELPDAPNDSPSRYHAEERPLPDENTGRDVKPVLFGRKNVSFLLNTEDNGGITTMPIARVRRMGVGQFAFDDRFVAPAIQLAAAPQLIAMLRRMIDLLEEKCRTVARPRDLGASPASGFSAEGIANAWFLHCLNSSLGPLRHICLSKRGHPEELFVELSRLAGALCTFGLESHPGSLPLYDHLQPGPCFEALDRHIREHLELIVPSNCIPIALSQPAQYFWEGRILDERTLNRSRWVLGLRCAIGEADLIEYAPRLVKVCSREFLPKLVERALYGLKLSHLSSPPPALSPRIEYQYFAIDKSGPCWEHMIRSREVAIYIPGELPNPEITLSVIVES